MRKRTAGEILKRKARNSAKQSIYVTLWGEKPAKKYRTSAGKLK